MPICALEARSKDFFRKTNSDLNKCPNIGLAGTGFVKNPDTFRQPIPESQIPKQLFLRFSRLSRHFSCLSPIFPTNEVKGVMACTLGSSPKPGKVCKKRQIPALFLTVLGCSCRLAFSGDCFWLFFRVF